MSGGSRIVSALITAFMLGLWRIWGESFYIKYLEAKGSHYGITEASIGYFLIIVTSIVISLAINRRLKRK